ncbi:class I adenylate-forming enzyme family protein [Novosphingobium lentum]|uniref:class I adenylate-forming enzyme family protein n=1 Tax=Novosphingobium lentum TaxID=145287 RepID=UPI0008358749|nr:class I adenylate-forming enzyme family protein [Novosphingobium lentum]
MALPVYEHDHLCVDAIAHNARFYRARTAVVCGPDRLTWQELDRKVNQTANALIGLGCTKGTKVCMFMPNAIESFVLFWGTVKAGGVIVPLNLMLDGASLARLATASEGVLIFANAGSRAQIDAVRGELPNIRADGFYLFGGAAAKTADGWADADALVAAASPAPPPVKVDAADAMTIIYTSGTTGTPKGIEHSHFGRLNYAYGFGAGLEIGRYSVAICATPIYASGTWITMLPTLYNGGKIVLLPKFTPAAFLDAVADEGGTHSFMVPAMYVSILQHADRSRDASTLKVLVSAGQTMTMATREQLAARFPAAGIYEVYGMTEGFFTIATPADFARGKRNTVGMPGFLEDIRIVGEDDAELATNATGEIVAYGPGMMNGYYGRPDLTEETVWVSPAGRTYLRSGDLGHIDDDGFLYVSGRKKDMIKSGGINIYAVDIEEVLMAHEAVGEVAVIGIPDERWTETPIAVVALRPGSALGEDELLTWTNARLAKYQRLTRVVFADDFPRATYGKIQKDKLRETYGG